MTTLTIHPANSDQETAIRIFLDALHVEYKTGGDADDTVYLMSSPAMPLLVADPQLATATIL